MLQYLVCVGLKAHEAQMKNNSAISRAYFRGAKGAFVIFNIYNAKALEDARPWFPLVPLKSYCFLSKQIAQNSNAEAPVKVCLVGHDFESSERLISCEQATEFAKEFNVPYTEVSAKTGMGVDEMFFEMASKIVLPPAPPVEYTPSKLNELKKLALSGIAIEEEAVQHLAEFAADTKNRDLLRAL